MYFQMNNSEIAKRGNLGRIDELKSLKEWVNKNFK